MKEATLTVKLRLLPDEPQASAIEDCARAYIQAANYISQQEFNHPKTQTKSTRIQDKHYHYVRDTLKLKSQQACSVCRTVAATYETIQENNHHPKQAPHFKHAFYDAVRGRDYTLHQDSQTISLNTLDEKRLTIPYAQPHPEHMALLETGKLGTAKILKKHKKYFAFIPVTILVPDDADVFAIACEGANGACFVGVDRGLRFLAACYSKESGERLFSGKGVMEKRKQYKAKRSELQSKHTRSARHRLKAMGSRENRWMNDVNHCLSKTLVNSYHAGSVFVLEDLSGIRDALVRVRRRDRYVQVSWSYADLEAKLRYKALLRGSRVIEVSAACSSQECPVCGHVSKNNRDRSRHVFECEECGFTTNDDVSAAMVLCERGRVKVLAMLAEDASSQAGAQSMVPDVPSNNQQSNSRQLLSTTGTSPRL